MTNDNNILQNKEELCTIVATSIKSQSQGDANIPLQNFDIKIRDIMYVPKLSKILL